MQGDQERDAWADPIVSRSVTLLNRIQLWHPDIDHPLRAGAILEVERDDLPCFYAVEHPSQILRRVDPAVVDLEQLLPQKSVDTPPLRGAPPGDAAAAAAAHRRPQSLSRSTTLTAAARSLHVHRPARRRSRDGRLTRGKG